MCELSPKSHFVAYQTTGESGRDSASLLSQEFETRGGTSVDVLHAPLNALACWRNTMLRGTYVYTYIRVAAATYAHASHLQEADLFGFGGVLAR